MDVGGLIRFEGGFEHRKNRFMLCVIEIGIIQPVGSDIQTIDAGEHAAQHHHLGVFGIGGNLNFGVGLGHHSTLMKQQSH